MVSCNQNTHASNFLIVKLLVPLHAASSARWNHQLADARVPPQHLIPSVWGGMRTWRVFKAPQVVLMCSRYHKPLYEWLVAAFVNYFISKSSKPFNNWPSCFLTWKQRMFSTTMVLDAFNLLEFDAISLSVITFRIRQPLGEMNSPPTPGHWLNQAGPRVEGRDRAAATEAIACSVNVA